MYRHGWYQIAFEQDLTGDVCPVTAGSRQLVAVRTKHGIRVADAICPHRGANLGYGAIYEDGVFVCPFHGRRVGLGQASEEGFCVSEYGALVVGGLVFVRLSTREDNGFSKVMEGFADSRTIVPGFMMKVRSAPDIVIENAFDQAHFHSVHDIGTPRAFRVRPGECGEFGVDGMFNLPPSQWQRGQSGAGGALVPFTALAFSPGIVVSHLGGQYPYTVITAATSTSAHECVIWLSLVLPLPEDGRPIRRELCDFLLRRSRAGLDRDRVIWEHRAETAAPHFGADDEPVTKFQEFCSRFTEAAG